MQNSREGPGNPSTGKLSGGAVVGSHFVIALWSAKRQDPAREVLDNHTAILASLSASLGLAEDFKTIDGKEYKNATVSRVESDGIVLKTKSGITKVYFAELPKDVQERFLYASATPTGKAVTQRIGEAESAKPSSTVVDGTTAVDKFAQRVSKELEEREAILQGKHTPGPAETAILREFTFHKAFLAVTAIVAAVLFAIVWARVK